MVKKTIALILCIMMLLPIFGCATEKAEQPQTKPAASTNSTTADSTAKAEPVSLDYEYSQEMLDWAADIKAKYEGTTLNLAGYAHTTLDAIKPMIPDFEALTGINVAVSETDLDKIHDKMVLDMTSNSKDSYDVVMVPDSNAPEYIELGFLEPLNDYIANEEEWFDVEDIAFAYRDLYMDINSEKLYAIPQGGETGIFYYRTDIFEKYGFEVPTTTEEVLALAKEITDMNLEVDGKRMYGVSFRGRPSLGGANWMFQVYAYSFGGKITDPSNDITPTVNTPEAAAAVNWMTELCKVGVPGIAAFDPNDAINAFKNGSAAMCLEASVFGADVEDPSQSVAAGKTGYSAFPAGPAGQYNAVFGIAFGISSKSNNKDAAWAFIEWCCSKANQHIYLDNNGPVARDSGLSDPDLQAKYPFYQAILDAGQDASDLAKLGMRPTPKILIALQYINAYAVNVSAAMSGEVTPEVAVERLQADMEQIASDANLLG